MGGPYASIAAGALVATALNTSPTPLGVGVVPPGNADAAQLFTGNLIIGNDANLAFNAYIGAGSWRAQNNGPTGFMTFDTVSDGGFEFLAGTAPGAGQPLNWSTVFGVDVAGNASLPLGTLSVARDPAQYFDVATMGWVSNNTVSSFNTRKGNVTLNQADIYGVLCLDSPIASQNYVQTAITNGLQHLLTTCPFVNRWNGRTGSVYLMLTDITTVFFQPGQQPISPTPPITSNDNSIATTQWVTEYIANEFAGSGGNLATQSWVLANTVNSFNGRQGIVTLTAADVFDVGAASLNSPNFSGIPTAPTANLGQATGQIATTAFVQQAISHNTAGVSSFNTRVGDVVLDTADITTAGGLTNPSPNLTGAPTAPTAAPGTSTPQIANCQFVTTALANTVTSFNTRTGAISLTTADITGAGGAPIISPAFSSVPTAPTAAPGTNTVQLATCAFVTAAVTASGGVSSFNSRTGAVDLLANDISAAGGLINPSVNLTGVPTAPTAPTSSNTTQIATTAFVVAALAGTVTSFNTRAGAVTLTGADLTGAGGALLSSPNFSGVPTAPTAIAGTNNTQIATTQFVLSAILADTTHVSSFNGRTGAVTLTAADITSAGGAPIASPAFTGTPQGPTATAGTSTTQLATTSFVMAAIAASGVASFNGRTGAVTLIANDVSAVGGALIASPAFTGTPTAPTATAGTSTTQLATTQFVSGALAGYLPLVGGVINGTPGTLIVTNRTFAPAPAFGSTVAERLCAGEFAVNAYNDGTNVRAIAAGSAGYMSILSGALTLAVSSPVAAGAVASLATIVQASLTGGPNNRPNVRVIGDFNANVTYGGNAAFIFSDGSTASDNGFRSDIYWRLPWSTLQLGFYFNPVTYPTPWMSFRPSDNAILNNWGTFISSSDGRLKRDVGPDTHGLAEVLQLNPIRFRRMRKPNDPNPSLTWEDGFDAGEVQAWIPEAVVPLADPGEPVEGSPSEQPGPSDRSGGPMLGINVIAIVAALVNALKEMSARLERLEGAPA